MNNIGIEQVAELVGAAEKVAVFTHENPDGDAIGSSAGLAAFLRKCGKQVELVYAAPPPAMYRKFVTTPHRLEISAGELASCDLVIQLDTSNPERIAAPLGVVVNSHLPLLVIDHHMDNQRYGRWNRIEPAAATAMMVFELAERLNPSAIDAECATLLLLGLVTDTGGFRFANTDSSALEVGAGLIELGADHQKIVDAAFFTQSLNRRKFEAELILNHLELRCDGRLAIVRVPAELVAKYAIDMASTEGLIDAFRCVAGVEVTALMYYRKNHKLKISFRGRDATHPVRPIADALGGGGHELAAACLIENGNMEEAADRITQLFLQE